MKSARPHLGKILLLIAAVILLLISNMHSFLSYNMPVNAEILVVEGWIDIGYMPTVLEEFRNDHYERIVVVGDAADNIAHNTKMRTNADARAERLLLLSNYKVDITVVNSEYVNKNQTYNYLLGFKNWLTRELPATKSVNLFSVSVHARKSYLILRRILPNTIKVGVISAAPLSYNPERWWLSRKGLWVVFKNTIAYIDAFLFEHCRNMDC